MNELRKQILSIEEEKERYKFFAFTIPNGMSLSTLFLYGISNDEFYLKNQSLLTLESAERDALKNSGQHIIAQKKFINHFINFRSVIRNEPIPKDFSSDNFYFLYDRNPNIINNLIKILKLILPPPITSYVKLDNIDKHQIGNIIEEKLQQTRSYEYACFYSNNYISEPNIPLYYHSKHFKHSKNFFHSLYMAVGLENNICVLRLNSYKKSFQFCNENITEDDITYGFSNFCPFILIYKPCFLKEKIRKFTNDIYSTKHHPSPPPLQLSKDILSKFVFSKENKWTKKQLTFDEYLIQCLKFPAAFVAGTEYSFDPYAYYLTIIFTHEVSMKETILQKTSSDATQSCRQLFNYYQKFLSFLRYLFELIRSFIKKDSVKFIENMKMTFSLLPVINSSIVSSFIDFIKLLSKRIDVNKSERKKVEDTCQLFIDCCIDFGKGLSQNVKLVFQFSKQYEETPITVHQAYEELKKCFKDLSAVLGQIELGKLSKIDLSSKDTSKNLKIQVKFRESTSTYTFRRNDIVI